MVVGEARDHEQNRKCQNCELDAKTLGFRRKAGYAGKPASNSLQPRASNLITIRVCYELQMRASVLSLRQKPTQQWPVPSWLQVPHDLPLNIGKIFCSNTALSEFIRHVGVIFTDSWNMLNILKTSSDTLC